MKRIIILVIVAVVVSSAVFAQGGTETGNGEGNHRAERSNGETVTLTGNVIENDGHVLLETRDGTVSLSAPGFPRSGAEVPFGETIEVTGTLTDCNDTDCDMESEGHLFVEAAVSESGSYTFENGRGNSGGNGNSSRGGNRSETGNRRQDSGNGMKDGSGRSERS